MDPRSDQPDPMQRFYAQHKKIAPEPPAEPRKPTLLERFEATPFAPLVFLVWTGIWSTLVLRSWIDGPRDHVPFSVGAVCGAVLALALRGLRHRLADYFGDRKPAPWFRNDANYLFEGLGLAATFSLSFVLGDETPFLGLWYGGVLMVALHWSRDSRREAIEIIKRYEAQGPSRASPR